MDIEKVKQATTLIRDGLTMLQSGPLDYYLKELIGAHDLLMARFSPFKVGDRVVLVKAPDFDLAPGWRHCSHFMVPGAAGVVVGADCGSRGFRFEVVFDQESWIDDHGYQRPKGTVVPMEENHKHRFAMGESFLALEPKSLPTT